ncbi:hypothetical protein J1N35_018923 [Gossypium stocksii]|uniref:RNase H type-1 domain-containing protein n=1 Tax=Gossypium stocksii TaxID=47602 RepID=A0A9D3VPU1_9ROSI|nr:hypothetical protein J1N35_018923 [Gossypium stocksii]
MDDATRIWERAQSLSSDFRFFNLSKPSVFNSSQDNKGWEKPQVGYIKVNVDAAVLNGCSGFGAIARDQDGFVIGGGYKFAEKSMEVIWAELEAFREGLKLAARLNVNNLIVESDSARLVNAINKRAQDITILACASKRSVLFLILLFQSKLIGLDAAATL